MAKTTISIKELCNEVRAEVGLIKGEKVPEMEKPDLFKKLAKYYLDMSAQEWPNCRRN